MGKGELAKVSRLVLNTEAAACDPHDNHGPCHEKIIVLGGLAEVSARGLTVLADVATSLDEIDRAAFADKIGDMEAKLTEKEGFELDRAIERLDHFKSIQSQLNSTAMH
jgi:F-type H+-transporting ATPase subunit epsilon